MRSAVVVPIELARSTADEEQARRFLQLFGELRLEGSASLDVLRSSPYLGGGSHNRRVIGRLEQHIERVERDLREIERMRAALHDRRIT